MTTHEHFDWGRYVHDHPVHGGSHKHDATRRTVMYHQLNDRIIKLEREARFLTEVRDALR